MTVRWVISHMMMLQDRDGSRLWRHYSNERLDRKEHILTDIFEVLVQIAFTNSISASADAGKEAKKIFKKAPERMVRPTYRETIEEIAAREDKPVFMNGRDLVGMFHDGALSSKVKQAE
jgi:hypothetical protein